MLVFLGGGASFVGYNGFFWENCFKLQSFITVPWQCWRPASLCLAKPRQRPWVAPCAFRLHAHSAGNA